MFVSVPERHGSAFERALDDGRDAAPTAAPRTPSTTRPMRIVLGIVVFKFLAVAAAGASLIAGSTNTGTAQALAGLSALVLLGVVALRYACYESWLARRERARSDG